MRRLINIKLQIVRTEEEKTACSLGDSTLGETTSCTGTFTDIDSCTARRRMMRCTLIGALVAAFLVAVLVERAESHFTFFSPKEMREMMERGRAGKKSVDLEPRSEEGQFEEVAIPERSEEVGGAQGKAVEIGVRLSAKQLEQVAPAFGEILHEMLTETEKAK
ncbi:hypothetical protein SKAU_G00355200 [Synaphobranchus kaupii]|uniref:Uncharacterized protein n=1 Tax=Synaphobranchus kaupii TaxID=118154 RepID=A0A9Q1EH58_SYNKA|nr:hypothetical protein SKAU_G00355200 [Synaphobranchus kaupii]